MKKSISTNQAPQAIGPYSQATAVGNLVFVSGQIPLDPNTGQIIGSDIKTQTKQSFENIKGILTSQGLTMNHVAKATVLLADIQDFAGMNEVYAEYFDEPYPARAAFAVKDLPKGALVEIEVIASID
ncbi:RidA family protein [Spirochaeta cellobiosiphila]|uniref:RidA family protein n=1 Tax=Spirochaeta cellobiosiphila TaxID=504483 RepID=UPI000413E825|nr:RidA family protein [Spirochaeta cellobiosiphila]